MNHKPVALYLIGGTTGLIGSLLMLVSSYLVTFHLQAAYLGTSDGKMAFIASHPLVGMTHGFGVTCLILMVPTVVALFALLNPVATARSFLGTGFALLWLCIELVGQLSQTAPLRALSELHNDPLTLETAVALYNVLEEFWEACSLTGTFVSALMSLCYGLALIDGWNRPSGYLFLIAILAFPIGLAIPGIGIQLHVALRGLAFFIVAGVLLKRATSRKE